MSMAFASCEKKIDGNSPITTKNFEVSPSASQIQVQSTMQLILSNEMEEGEISIKANDNIHQYINVVKDNNEVAIELDQNNYSDLSIEVLVSSSQYNAIVASGASTVTMQSEPPVFEDFSVTLSGASKANLIGTVEKFTAVASGASEFYGNFTCDALIVDLSGASIVEATVNNSISGKLSGASKVKYRGDATVSVESTGASSVERL